MSFAYPLLLAFWGLTSTTWLALWSVLAILTLMLVVLLRTRWSQARPWRKCAILSLWVHLLLACAAMTVRIVTGAPDLGAGEEIRVSVTLVTEIEEVQPPEEEITPNQETHANPLEAPALEPTAEPADESPELVETLSPAEPASAPETKSQVATAPTALSSPVSDPVPVPDTFDRPSQPTVAPSELPKTYAERFADNREQLVAESGGSEQTERAVRAALGWLAQTQSTNGGWDASKFGAGDERVILGQDRNGAGANADTGITGLALLAFLGSGHTHRSGPYAAEVARGLEYLRQRQRANGALHGDAQVFAQMYCHSMATFAVCEALAMTRDPRLEPMAQAAVRYTLSMQHPTDGGWRYLRGHTGDTSQLGWQLMTLRSAELAGVAIPEVTWTRANRFLSRVRRGNSGGLASYRPDGPPSRTMTAEAMYCRQVVGSRSAAVANLGANFGVNEEATRSVVSKLPDPGRRNLYMWYYATLALHHNRDQSPAAATAWDDWNHALTTTLLTTQQNDGSWSATTVWGGYGGRVYTTALSAMCLEVYYRYSPARAPGPPSELAGRGRWSGVRR